MRHITNTDRIAISTLLKEGNTLTRIAAILGFSKGTISKELKRNMTNGVYNPEAAQKKADERAHQPKKTGKFLDLDLMKRIRDGLDKHHSPEQISGRMKLEAERHPESPTVHCSTIYDWIDKGFFNFFDAKGREVSGRKLLRRKGKRRRRKDSPETRGRFPITRTIHERPEAANNRERFMDVEVDLVLGSTNVALLTIVDRKTRFLFVTPLQSKRADETACALIQTLSKYKVKSITCDRGKEFSLYAVVEKALGTEFYFADAGCPQHKPTNENTNGLLREFFPKGTPIPYDFELIRRVQKLINDRPRKVHVWKSSTEMFEMELLAE